MTNDEDITGNIGEWSELYALLKILGDGHLQAGEGDLTPNAHPPLPVLAAARTHSGTETSYRLVGKKIIVTGLNGDSSLSQKECAEWATQLLIALKLDSKTAGARSIPTAKKWMQALQTAQLKAQSSDKTDIQLVLHDIHTGLAPKLGFSIKSRLGAPSSLLNANADNTNAIFEFTGIDEAQASAFNAEKKFKQKFAKLPDSYKLEFSSYAKTIFASNLRVVDGEIPALLAYLIQFYYEGASTSKVVDLSAALEVLNPFEIDLVTYPCYYSHKIKRFLVDVALGFTPAKPWMGCYDATGGYIVVKESGDLLSYHVYNRNQFENYLFHNTQLDTPSTSRHDHGSIYQENGVFKLKLNLQIRFFH
jgi:HpaII restriction endonuclease